MKKTIFISLLIGVIATSVESTVAKKPKMADLIAANNSSESMGTFYNMKSDVKYEIDVDGYDNPDEFIMRRGLPNFFRKCAAGKEVTVAYIGGSITQVDNMYRQQTSDYINSMFPDCKMNGINAGIGGTSSDIGACRLYEHVLKYKPDLLFIEYAVNEANPYGAEGIVRQTIKDNPETDICFIHTIYGGQSEIYAAGEIPENVKRLERVAEHYNIPSIHMGMWSGDLVTSGEIVWGERDVTPAPGVVAFTKDSVHPTADGGCYYASAVARGFEAMKNHQGKEKFTLIEPLSDQHMEFATTIKLSDLNIDSTWDIVKCDGDKNFDSFKYWFDDIYNGDINSTPIKFKFKGTKVGIFDIGAYDGCAVNIIIDGKKYIETKVENSRIPLIEFASPDDPRCSKNRFIPLCVITYRGQYILCQLESDGVHEVEISVAPHDSFDKVSIAKQSPKYEEYKDRIHEQQLHLGRIIIEGVLVK